MSEQTDKSKKKSKSRLAIFIVAGLFLLAALLVVHFFWGSYVVIPSLYSQTDNNRYALKSTTMPVRVSSISPVFYTDYTGIGKAVTTIDYTDVEFDNCSVPAYVQCLYFKNWDSHFYPSFRASYKYDTKIKSGTDKIRSFGPECDTNDSFDILITVNGILVAYADDVSGKNTIHAVAAKPVIYLYPEETTDIDVNLDLDGYVTSSYPSYNDGWSVTAEPDGTLTDKSGRMYNYLFWEGDLSNPDFDYSNYFCVPGDETAKFLEEYLFCAGLTDQEADDFISYWLPKMQNNKFNMIFFQTDAYEDEAKLNISPEPDTVIRVYMVYYGTEEYVLTNATMPETPIREGFTVVEWGGTELTD